MDFTQFKQRINHYLSKDMLGKAIEVLKVFTAQGDFHNEVITQSGKFEYLQRQVRNGVVDTNWSTIERNRIRVALQEIIKEIEEEEGFKKGKFLPLYKGRTSSNVNFFSIFSISTVVIIILVLGFNKFLFSQKETTVNDHAQIVLMDSGLKDVVYDVDGWKDGLTNADKITEVLDDIDGLNIIKELTNLRWSREEQLFKLAPDLIIIHISCFYDKTHIEDSDRKFYSFIEYLSELDTKWIIYSRGFHHERIWKENLVRDFPKLRNKVETLKVESPSNFSDVAIQRKLKTLVKKSLNL